MQIITVRHASTEYNEKQIINGQIDEDLSPHGLKQISGLLERLAGYDFNVVYASTMKRSVQTAKPIAEKFDAPLRKDHRIIEVGRGSFEGKSEYSTVPVFGKKSADLLNSYKYDFKLYGGECADETRTRVQSFLNDLKSSRDEKPLIVTHGGILRWIDYLCTGQKVGLFPNLAIETFEI